MSSLLKKERSKIRIITVMLLMIEKGITGGISHAIHRYTKVNNKYMINYDKSKESCIHYSICMDGQLFQKLPVDGFKWKKIC